MSLHQAADGGFDLYLGPGLQSSLTTVLTSCGDDTSKCESNVQNTLTDANYEIQSRQVGVALWAGGLLLASFVYECIELYKIRQKVPVRMNIDGTIASKITPVDSSVSLVVATATNDPGLGISDIPGITGAPVNPSTITGSQISISTATDSPNGHQSK